jgi:predicted alpha/beta hydrolase family esterase
LEPVATFLILHGWSGSGVEHWQTWLARRLDPVLYPTLPEPDEPRLDRWLAALDHALHRAGEDAVVLCHSLACILWFHHAARRPAPVARALLVAPPTVVYDEFASFFPVPYDAEAVTAAARETLLVCATDDPYAPGGADGTYSGLPTRRLEHGAHLNTDAGYGPWPWIEEWALSPR